MNETRHQNPAKKINYNEEMEKIVDECIKLNGETGKKKSLLLHACCGPCSSAVIERLSLVFDMTIFFYNPNIHPVAEHDRRLEELKKFLSVFPDSVKNGVKLVVASNYNPEEYFEATNVRNEIELQAEREKGERCRRCYAFRMKKAFEYACANGFDFFTTTLSISPHKDSEKINTIGIQLESERADECVTKFLPSDFKKKGGFLRSTELSEEYGLWRQDYCGCVYSMRKD